ncbi:MAG TPA: phosphatidate cytidylyltransferase, partial [bacterium]|nr:phosphatidate cytidylyltransferase [bacterium]
MLLRLATGIPLGIIAIWLMAFPSGWVQFAGVALVAVFALRELHRLLGLQTNGFPNGSCAPWGYVFLLLIMLLVHLEAWGTMTLWMAGFFIALALHQLRRYPLEDAYLREPGLVFLASTYLGIGLGCLFQLRVLGEQWMASGLMPAGNLNLVALIPMLATWGYDSSALFAGAATGTLPMAPQISPKKSWEGVTGG